MKIDDPALSAHGWLSDAVHQGLAELHTAELASFPVEAEDGSLQGLVIATELGLVEGTLAGPAVDGFPGLILDLRLWRDVPVSARARIDTQHGVHSARVVLTVGGRTISSYALRTREAATDVIREVLIRSGQVGRA
jgi:hypothetical protein